MTNLSERRGATGCGVLVWGATGCGVFPSTSAVDGEVVVLTSAGEVAEVDCCLATSGEVG